MQTREVFFSFVLMFILILFIMTGGFFLLAACQISLFEDLIADLQKTRVQLVAGLSFVALGFLLSVIFFKLCARGYILFQTENGKIAIDAKIFEATALKILKPYFENQKIGCKAVVQRKKKLKLFLDLPGTSLDAREIPFETRLQMIEELEEPLKRAFRLNCGYERPFLLSTHWS